MNMIWIYRALAVTALITRLIIIYENVEKFQDRRRIKKRVRTNDSR